MKGQNSTIAMGTIMVILTGMDLCLMGYIMVTIMHTPIKIVFTGKAFSDIAFIVRSIHGEWHIVFEVPLRIFQGATLFWHFNML
jgi:hypothetical protein